MMRRCSYNDGYDAVDKLRLLASSAVHRLDCIHTHMHTWRYCCMDWSDASSHEPVESWPLQRETRLGDPATKG